MMTFTVRKGRSKRHERKTREGGRGKETDRQARRQVHRDKQLQVDRKTEKRRTGRQIKKGRCSLLWCMGVVLMLL